MTTSYATRPTNAEPVSPPPATANPFDTWLLNYVGALAWWLKTHWIFAGAILVAVAAAPFFTNVVPKQTDGSMQSWVPPTLILLAVVGGLSALGDKLADRFESKAAEGETTRLEENGAMALLQAEQSFQQSLSELNWLMEMALRIPFLEGDAEENQVETVRFDVVKAVAAAVGPGTRATYYTLIRDDDGMRRLVRPKHAVTNGRSDRPEREWVESKNPTHEMWTLLDRSDSEPNIVRDPADASGLDWDKVDYRCFLSIPVRASSITFGLLSVSCSDIGGLRETERSLILTAARLLAFVEASHAGVEGVRAKLAMSEVPHKVIDNEERLEHEHR